MARPLAVNGQWSTGIWGCFEDTSICCCGLFCPCVLVGRIVEVLDQGATTSCSGGCTFCMLIGCGCFYTFGYRARLRQKFELPATPCADFCTDCFCLDCSICQVYRELKYRGIDPVLGYPAVKHVYDAPPQHKYEAPSRTQGPPIFDEPPMATMQRAPDQQNMTPAPQNEDYLAQAPPQQSMVQESSSNLNSDMLL